MKIFPAIDLFNSKAVRLFKGDYSQMKVYSDNPIEIAQDFKKCGATNMHVVDLEGAKNGDTPNFEVIKKLVSVGLFTEVGGGIRNLETVKKYINVGVGRVILGTAAVTDRNFLISSIKNFKDKIAVGVDIKDGVVAIKGWTEKSNITALDFCLDMEKLGVKTIICTDISKDGVMKGTNVDLYKFLMEKVNLDIIASGGVSSYNDIKSLIEINAYGAIIGKAYYEKTIELKEVIKLSNAN